MEFVEPIANFIRFRYVERSEIGTTDAVATNAEGGGAAVPPNVPRKLGFRVAAG
jgi:hypothetical protein